MLRLFQAVVCRCTGERACAVCYFPAQKHHPNTFLSLSRCINSRSPNHRALIAAADPQRLLVESDYPLISEIASETWAMVETIAEVRGWKIERSWDEYGNSELDEENEESWGVVRRLEMNWRRFLKGGHAPKVKSNKKQRADYSYQDWPDSEEDSDN